MCLSLCVGLVTKWQPAQGELGQVSTPCNPAQDKRFREMINGHEGSSFMKDSCHPNFLRSRMLSADIICFILLTASTNLQHAVIFIAQMSKLSFQRWE